VNESRTHAASSHRWSAVNTALVATDSTTSSAQVIVAGHVP
jgi:hypothetical protein